MKWLGVLIALVLLTVPAAASSGADDARVTAALQTSAAAIGRVLPDLAFTDVDDKPFRLFDQRGKPLLISMVYTGCADVCPLIVENLYKAVDVAQEALGVDAFTTVTIGFDTAHDTPERMRAFARAHGADLPNWYFLAADNASIEALTVATGFTFMPSAGGFDHMAQVTIVDHDGAIYSQVFGGAFTPQAVVEPLKDLLFGNRRPVPLLTQVSERIRLFCTIYNPNTGRYYFNYSLFIGIGIGIACMSLVAGWLIREFRRSGRPV
jgi:protein SCO1/2